MSKFSLKKVIEEEKIPLNEVESMLSAKEYKCKLGEKEGEIDGKRAYIRPGSKKARGWQITLRGEFIEHARAMKGYLVVNRGKGYLIPMVKLKKWLKNKLDTTTRDIYIRLDEEKVYSTRELKPLDISDFGIKTD